MDISGSESEQEDYFNVDSPTGADAADAADAAAAAAAAAAADAADAADAAAADMEDRERFAEGTVPIDLKLPSLADRVAVATSSSVSEVEIIGHNPGRKDSQSTEFKPALPSVPVKQEPNEDLHLVRDTVELSWGERPKIEPTTNAADEFVPPPSDVDASLPIGCSVPVVPAVNPKVEIKREVDATEGSALHDETEKVRKRVAYKRHRIISGPVKHNRGATEAILNSANEDKDLLAIAELLLAIKVQYLGFLSTPEACAESRLKSLPLEKIETEVNAILRKYGMEPRVETVIQPGNNNIIKTRLFLDKVLVIVIRTKNREKNDGLEAQIPKFEEKRKRDLFVAFILRFLKTIYIKIDPDENVGVDKRLNYTDDPLSLKGGIRFDLLIKPRKLTEVQTWDMIQEVMARRMPDDWVTRKKIKKEEFESEGTFGRYPGDAAGEGTRSRGIGDCRMKSVDEKSVKRERPPSPGRLPRCVDERSVKRERPSSPGRLPRCVDERSVKRERPSSPGLFPRCGASRGPKSCVDERNVQRKRSPSPVRLPRRGASRGPQSCFPARATSSKRSSSRQWDKENSRRRGSPVAGTCSQSSKRSPTRERSPDKDKGRGWKSCHPASSRRQTRELERRLSPNEDERGNDSSRRSHFRRKSGRGEERGKREVGQERRKDGRDERKALREIQQQPPPPPPLPSTSMPPPRLPSSRFPPHFPQPPSPSSSFRLGCSGGRHGESRSGASTSQRPRV